MSGICKEGGVMTKPIEYEDYVEKIRSSYDSNYVNYVTTRFGIVGACINTAIRQRRTVLYFVFKGRLHRRYYDRVLSRLGTLRKATAFAREIAERKRTTVKYYKMTEVSHEPRD